MILLISLHDVISLHAFVKLWLCFVSLCFFPDLLITFQFEYFLLVLWLMVGKE